MDGAPPGSTSAVTVMTADIADLRVERIDAKDTFRNNGSSNHFNAFRGRLQQIHESGDTLDAGPPLSREISPRNFLSVSPYSLAVSVIGARSADPGRMSQKPASRPDIKAR